MRNVIRLFAVISIVMCSTIITAQGNVAKKIEVIDVTKVLSLGKQNGLKMNIYQATKKQVEKDWTNTIRVNTKSKVENINNELFIIQTNIKAISPNPVNIYSVINEYPDYVELNAFVEVDGKFISSNTHETEYLGARKFLRDFGIACYKDAVKEELGTEESTLKGLEKEFKKLVGENDKLYKDISQEERSIEVNKKEIQTNELDQRRTRGLIEQQKSQLAKLRSEEQKKEAEKVLKNFESDLTKLQKQHESLHKDIDKSEAKIRGYQRSIKSNENDMARKQVEIEGQKKVVYQVEKKLQSIG